MTATITPITTATAAAGAAASAVADPLVAMFAALPQEQQIASTLAAIRMARAGTSLLMPSADLSLLDRLERDLSAFAPALAALAAPAAAPALSVTSADDTAAALDRAARYPRYRVSRHAAALRRQVTTPRFDPSDLQLAVLDFVKYGKGHGVVNAVAGAGKTTTLVEAARLITGTALFLAFNVKTAEALKSRLAGTSMTAATIHSVGMRTVSAHLGRGVQVDPDKYDKIVRGLPRRGSQPATAGTAALVFPPTFGGMQPDRDTIRAAERAVLQLARLARLTLTDASDSAAMDLLCQQFTIDFDPVIAAGIYRAVRATLERGEEIARLNKIIDFDDMVWLPERWSLKPQQVDFALVDECQDLNRAQRRLVLKLVKPTTGRLLFVGDPNQSIYGFAGADVESFWNILDDTGAYLLDLSICYRCPTAVISLAQSLVPQIQAAPGAQAGAVRTIKEEKLGDEVREGDMILCRVTAPLVSQCMSLIAAGKPARVMGRDIGRAMADVIKAVMTLPGAQWDGFNHFLDQYESALEAKLQQRENNENAIEMLHDKCAAVRICYERYDAASPEELMARINNLFADDKEHPAIRLSTVHRAKGAENPRVYLLKPSKLPLQWQNQQPWEAQQERNIQYVAYTRALAELIFVEEAA